MITNTILIIPLKPRTGIYVGPADETLDTKKSSEGACTQYWAEGLAESVSQRRTDA